MMNFKFYDTCSLLLKAESSDLWEENMVISSITLDELETIKTAGNKDPEVKCAARKVLKVLDEYFGQYEVVQFKEEFLMPLKEFSITNDLKIISCALNWTVKHPDVNLTFITNDLACKHLAHCALENVSSYIEKPYEYDGFKEIYLNENEMAEFYQNPDINNYNVLANEYVLLYNQEGELVDKLCWTGDEFRHLTFGNFRSSWLGEVKPLKNDPYQALLADSLINNKITLVKGPAGSGKSFLSLGYLMHLLSTGRIDKIIVFCNTVATKGAARLGFLPGTRDEKLLDSQIGNMLASKLGDKIAVEQLIQRGQLVLLPMSDVRGYDTTGMRAGIYITEAQNLDISLMKLALQRIGEDSICILDGDYATQLDMDMYGGANNGMRRVSQIFRGSRLYGEITLKKIHRSAVAALADKL